MKLAGTVVEISHSGLLFQSCPRVPGRNSPGPVLTL
nr:MAG TPA: hypothetical protein [Caudoviricetes sp.]